MYANQYLEQKRLEAIKWLSTRWVLHPNYVFNPKHCPISR